MTRNIGAAIFFIVLCLAITARADFYTYKDGRGTVHMTNKLESVPEKYRATMKVTKEEKKPEPAAQVQPEQGQQSVQAPQQVQEDPQPQTRFGQLSKRHPWLKPLLAVCGLLAGFIVIVKIANLLPSPHMSRLIYIGFFLGVFLFGYKLYANHLVNNYFSVKSRILTMFKKANEREGLQPEAKSPDGQPEAKPASSLNEQLKELK